MKKVLNKRLNQTAKFGIFLFNNAFKIAILGSTAYIIYKYYPEIGLFKLQKPAKGNVEDIFYKLLAGEGTASMVTDKIPNKELKKLLKNIIPDDIEIKIEVNSIKNIFKKLFIKGKVDQNEKDTRLIESILREVEKNSK